MARILCEEFVRREHCARGEWPDWAWPPSRADAALTTSCPCRDDAPAALAGRHRDPIRKCHRGAVTGADCDCCGDSSCDCDYDRRDQNRGIRTAACSDVKKTTGGRVSHAIQTAGKSAAVHGAAKMRKKTKKDHRRFDEMKTMTTRNSIASRCCLAGATVEIARVVLAHGRFRNGDRPRSHRLPACAGASGETWAWALQNYPIEWIVLAAQQQFPSRHCRASRKWFPGVRALCVSVRPTCRVRAGSHQTFGMSASFRRRLGAALACEAADRPPKRSWSNKT